MRPARLVFLVSVAMLVFAAIGSSAAFAEPEFEGEATRFTGSGGQFLLTADGGIIVIKCESSSSLGALGEIVSRLFESYMEFFHGCKSSGEGGKNCTAKGLSAEGLIVTPTLKGTLGLILPKSTKGTGVGLLLLPENAGFLASVEANTCTPAIKVTGGIAGEVEPIGKRTTTPVLRFALSSGKQLIKTIDLTGGGLSTPRLIVLAAEATEQFAELLEFPKGVEVT
jgi:hypothetical protein